MKLTAAAIAKIAGAVVAAGVTSLAGAAYAHNEHADQLTTLIGKIDALSGKVDAAQVDIRLLKCAADFPGDCPGQAARRGK